MLTAVYLPRRHIDQLLKDILGTSAWETTAVAPNFTFFHIAQSRGKKVLEEILGQFFPGIITSD